MKAEIVYSDENLFLVTDYAFYNSNLYCLIEFDYHSPDEKRMCQIFCLSRNCEITLLKKITYKNLPGIKFCSKNALLRRIASSINDNARKNS